MDITAVSLTQLPSNPRLLAQDQAPALSPAPDQSASAKGPASLAASSAALYAGQAESLTGQMQRSIALYNANNQEATESTVARYRAGFGDETADRTDKTMRFLRAEAGQAIAAQDQALRGQFAIAGDTHLYDKAADRYAPGRFTATLDAPGYAVRFDSASGARISVAGAPFTANFPRAAEPPAGPALLDISV